MKSYTDIEQSKKLTEILPPESADNVIVSIGDREGVKTITIPKETFNILRTPFSDIRNTISCWSLAALLDVLPEGVFESYYVPNIQKEGGRYSIAYGDEKLLYIADNPVDACVKMILKLHEQNIL